MRRCSLFLCVCLLSLRRSLGGGMLRRLCWQIPALRADVLHRTLVPSAAAGRLNRYPVPLLCASVDELKSANSKWTPESVFVPEGASGRQKQEYVKQWTDVANYWDGIAKAANAKGVMAAMTRFTLQGTAKSARQLAQDLRLKADQNEAATAAASPRDRASSAVTKKSKGQGFGSKAKEKKSSSLKARKQVPTAPTPSSLAAAWEVAASSTEAAEQAGWKWTPEGARSVSIAAGEFAQLAEAAGLEPLSYQWASAASGWEKEAKRMEGRYAARSVPESVSMPAVMLTSLFAGSGVTLAALSLRLRRGAVSCHL
eukprot:gnl/TRDRNA2_/TRDRNA2_83113_c0_seq1.p1 gnl/TRDRNA2_/TRDRNA2_83113_c0~~gnl/TRDRNA2_/TRDRNA2_83113_c0_seq1.p1  ORF type:complete len:313 (-),score=40.19 gnl/TRDRNA2_/TRDRNA2_83113_c0_seq1:136-1074(-)